MLAVARAAGRRRDGADVQFHARRRARARLSPIAASTSAVSLRVLMHTPEWRRCLAELCRVADRLVIVRLPVGASVALLESLMRRALARGSACGTEPYRVFTRRRDRRARSTRSGFRVRSVHRQFVLPIAVHKAIGSRRFTVRSKRAPRPRSACCKLLRIAGHARRRTVRVLVTGATGFTGGHLARGLARARPRVSARWCAKPARRRPICAPAGVELVGRRPARSRARARPAPRQASTSCITSPRSTGRRVSRTTRIARSTRRPSARLIEAAARGGVEARRALQHRRRARRRRASAGQRRRAAQAGRHLPGHQARRRAAGAGGRQRSSASR